MTRFYTALLTSLRSKSDNESGMTTAELLANAALAVAALVLIWAALSGIGSRVTSYISANLPG
jgi:hypothetical protein